MVVPVRVWLLSLGLLMVVVVEVVLLRLRLCLRLSVEGLLHIDALIGAGVKVHILHIHNISRPGQREIGCCSGGGAGPDGATPNKLVSILLFSSSGFPGNETGRRPQTLARGTPAGRVA